MKLKNKQKSNCLSFGQSLEKRVDLFKQTTQIWLKKGIALTGAALTPIIPFAPLLTSTGCNETENNDNELPNFSDGKSDWVHDEGIRNTDMIQYLNAYWSQYVNCQTRFCEGVDLFLKVMVKPVEGANLDSKRVGVSYWIPGYDSITVTGDYFTTYDNGYEEWHVRIPIRNYYWRVFVFSAWYQDGVGHTYFDDNNGENHIAYMDTIYSIIRQDWDNSHIEITDSGVNGRISIILADLDYDKDIKIVWTTDNWATTNESGMGSQEEKNKWSWVEDLWAGYERWAIDIDILGNNIEQFRYAIMYRHGVVNDAESYEFWDNNGGMNYILNRTTDENNDQ